MDRGWPEDGSRYDRLDADLTETDPADKRGDEAHDIQRRDRLSAIIDSIDPQPKTPQNPDVVYGDTDMNPHEDDQRDAHHGEGNTV